MCRFLTKAPICVSQTKLGHKKYAGVDDFVRDVRLVFDNAILFNEPKSDIANTCVPFSEYTCLSRMVLTMMAPLGLPSCAACLKRISNRFKERSIRTLRQKNGRALLPQSSRLLPKRHPLLYRKKRVVPPLVLLPRWLQKHLPMGTRFVDVGTHCLYCD